MNDLRTQKKTEKLQSLLSSPGRYVAITTEDRQFDRLIDRSIILEKVAEKLSDLILEEKQ